MCAVQSERLLKFQLEELREFLQEQMAVSFFLPDDEVVEQLHAAMSELRSKKLDHPPAGAVNFMQTYISIMFKLHSDLCLMHHCLIVPLLMHSMSLISFF